MPPFRQSKYEPLSDSELVELIVTPPHDEEAAYYLMYIRHEKLLKSVFDRVFADKPQEEYKEFNKKFDAEYKDALSEFLIALKGRRLDWNKLSTYSSDEPFKPWIKSVAYNNFLTFKVKLYNLKAVKDEEGNVHYISRHDDIDNMREKNIQQFQDVEYDEDEERARHLRNARVLMAVNDLDDEDDKLIILKKREGLKSKEIAEILKQSWESRGIKKYKNGKLVVPTQYYVNTTFQRARIKLLEIYNKKYN